MTNGQGQEFESRRQNQRPGFSARHRFAVREYWSWCCAVCETCDHPIQCTAWLDPSNLNSPGLVPTNMLPLCSVCISQKGNADPLPWLASRLGQKKADEKITQIQACFQAMADNKIIAFWFEIGLRHALQRFLKSTDPRGTLKITLTPGEDDDLLLWLNSLDHQQHQDTIKAALRAYMQSREFDPLRYLERILAGATSQRAELPADAEGRDNTHKNT